MRIMSFVTCVANGTYMGPTTQWHFFAFSLGFLLFFELFTNAIATHLIVFQTRKSEKTKRKIEKLCRVARGSLSF